MPILAGDIKLVASQVMDDVPEGGGAPTATVILDGVSNAIFPDISELDRAGGRVALRKLHVSVQTDDTSTYLGSNIIISEPPSDPNVSVTLFTTNDTFDTRSAASSRVESYLNKGGNWGGYLLDNHIAGQRSIQMQQEVGSELPAIGQTLVLVQNEGLPTEASQYIRTTAVSHITVNYVDDQGKPSPKWHVTCNLSDSLRSDYIGSEGGFDGKRAPSAARVRDTVVADAGTYVGVAPLTSAVDIGDFTVTAKSIFTQLVPSAQTETPISDLRTNGLSSALVATGGPITQSISMGFTTAQNLHVGGSIYPGSLTLVRSGVTVTDAGGLLMSASSQVGTVDYDNGVLNLLTNVWGTSGGTHEVTFTPATAPDLISDQFAIRVTAPTRSQSYVFTMGNPPVPRTLTVSYLAQGRWYVLRDNGAGVLSGISSEYGIGTLNYTTGSVSLTLGALPDVGSSVIVQGYSEVATTRSNNTLLTNGARVFAPINSDGLLSNAKGAKSYEPGTVLVTWNDGAARTATDTGTGQLVGDATGRIDYASGVVYLSPNTLPAPGTSFNVSHDLHDAEVAVAVMLANGNLGATNITPGSVSFSVFITRNYGAAWNVTLAFTSRQELITVEDDSMGNLRYGIIAVGSVNYATGAIAFSLANLPNTDIAGPSGLVLMSWGGGNTVYQTYPWNSIVGRTLTATHDPSTNITYSNTAGAANTVIVPVEGWLATTIMVPSYTLKGVGFNLGPTRYQQLTDNTLVRDPSTLTGGGTPSGSVAALLGQVTVQSWVTGATSLITNWRGLIAPPSVGVEAPFTGFSTTFRTATSPLRPASVSVLGTMQDGTTFNVTADANGKINGTRVKGRVDYQYGLVELYFVNPDGDVARNTDLSGLGIAGLGTTPADLVMLSSLRYNAVGFSYLPLDAELLGIDPVRLPSDGRVPIFRSGGFAVVGHTGSVTATVSNGQVIDCARVRLSRVRIIGVDGAVINTGYTADLETGLVTFTSVASYVQPVTIEHRIEDMAVVRDVQISGEVTFTRPMTHAYPIGSYLSSALISSDLKARVSHLFDQATWTGSTWLDDVSGSVATGTYNSGLSPIVVTNKGAVSERWALVFTNTTTFNIVGEHVGVIGTGSINTSLAPLNPATGVPYFTVPALGWGIGWATGNILRFNTVGAMSPVWVVRTVQQGPNTGIQHSFTLLSRGDVDRA